MALRWETAQSFAATKESVRLARHFIEDALTAWRVDLDPATIVLVTSELVTNSIIHAASEVRLRLRSDDSVLCLEVADDSARPPRVGHADDDATSGRGMALVERVCDDWGVTTVPGDGKVVWCRIDLNR